MKPQLSLEAFADWCEKQRAEKAYNYGDPRGCAFCQYLQSLGFEGVKVGPFDWRHADDAAFAGRPLPEGLDNAVMGGVFSADTHGAWTFGALAARLRAAQ